MKRAILIAAVLLLLAASLATGAGKAVAKPLFLLKPLELPTAIVLLIGLLCGGALVWGMSLYDKPVEAKRTIAYAAILPVMLLAMTLLIAAAVAAGKLDPGAAGLALTLIVLAALGGLQSYDALAKGEEIGFESHWGGLGGGSGGWRLLPPTGFALLSIVFAGAAVALVVGKSAVPLGSGRNTANASENGSTSGNGTAVDGNATVERSETVVGKTSSNAAASVPTATAAAPK